MTDAERGQLLTALLEYGKNGTQPQLEGAAMMAFSFIRAQKERDAEKYAETVKARSEAGKKGGRPKKAEAEEKQGKAKKANAFPKKQTKTKKQDTDTVTDTVINNNPPYPPKGGSTVQEERFASFWEAYPRKVGKKAAQNAWSKLKPDADLFDLIMEALKKAKASKEWTKDGGQFIPHPSTWINQGRWDDVLTPAENNEGKEQQHGQHSGFIDRSAGAESRQPAPLFGFKMASDQ